MGPGGYNYTDTITPINHRAARQLTPSCGKSDVRPFGLERIGRRAWWVLNPTWVQCRCTMANLRPSHLVGYSPGNAILSTCSPWTHLLEDGAWSHVAEEEGGQGFLVSEQCGQGG